MTTRSLQSVRIYGRAILFWAFKDGETAVLHFWANSRREKLLYNEIRKHATVSSLQIW